MCDKFTDTCCQYQSIRFITVKDKRIASIYYFIVFLVLLYVIGYTIIANKGYQATTDASGSTSIKIKGSGLISGDDNIYPLDAMDLVFPPNEQDAFFLAMSQITTRNQTQSVCDGNEDVPTCTASDASNCTENYYSPNSQGLFTGECGTNNRCQMNTWCPIENKTNVNIIENVGNFTVFVKVDVSFGRFSVQRTNTYDENGDGSPVFGYNLFTINDMLAAATNEEVTDYKDIAETGAIIYASSHWNCDFDYDVNQCQPKFSFQRVDNVANTISYGYNFRTVTYDVHKNYRLLEKLYGLRVMWIVEGSGSKFNFVALTVTLGAGLAYLSIAKVVTDLILDNFMGKHSDRYSTFKYHEIDDELHDPLQDSIQSGQEYRYT